MLKSGKVFLLAIIFWACGFAATGKLTVYSDNNNSQIYVDNEQVANGMIKNYNLEAGPHVVKVLIEGDTVYNKAVEIEENKNTIITSGDFEKLNAPSKLRADREARAWRDIKGYVALGLQLGSPNGGLAMKWWTTDRFGLQIQGWGNRAGDNSFTSLGGRLLIHLTDKLINGGTNVQETFLALGSGSDQLNGRTTYRSSEISFCFENPAGEAPGQYNSFEVGYEKTPGWIRDEGVKISYGYFWYF